MQISMGIAQPPSAFDRLRSTGLIVGPAAFISAWVAAGLSTPGYSPRRDHISDLAAIDAPTRSVMNLGFTAFAVAVGAAIMPTRRIVGTPAAAVLGANVALTIGIMLAPLGRSADGDRAHAIVAGVGYLALAAAAPSAAPTLARRSRRLAMASIGVGMASMACLGLSLVRRESGFWQRAGITATDAWMIGMGLLAVMRSSGDQQSATVW